MNKKTKHREFALVIRTGNAIGKLEKVERWVFRINPDINFLRVEDEKFKAVDIPKSRIDIAQKALSQWIFREIKAPFSDRSTLIWSIEPDFNKDDMEQIQRLYILRSV